jgi:hypothetical protein
MKKAIHKKYIALINISLFSIPLTIVSTFLLFIIINKITPTYENCYNFLENIKSIDDLVLLRLTYYTSLFIIYIVLFFFVFKKLLKKYQIQNIYTTTIILLVFNSFSMGAGLVTKYKLSSFEITYCINEKKSCQLYHKVIHNIDVNSSFNPDLKEIKGCIFDSSTYLSKVLELSKNKKNDSN